MMNWPCVSLREELHCSRTINPHREVSGNDVLEYSPEMSHPDAF